MLVARQGRRHRAGRAQLTYNSVVSNINAFSSLSLFLPLLSSSSTTASASIFASPLTLLQTSAS